MNVLATVLLAGLASSASAQTAPQSAPPGALSCTGCHALDSGAALPLGALSAGEIEAALAGYRDGTREATVMDRIARGFTPEESHAVARWIADHAREK